MRVKRAKSCEQGCTEGWTAGGWKAGINKPGQSYWGTAYGNREGYVLHMLNKIQHGVCACVCVVEVDDRLS